MGWIVLIYVLEVFKWLIVVRAVMSWFVSPFSDNPVVTVITRITDPILRPIAELIPRMGGIDLSPLIAFVAIVILQQLIGGLA